MVDSLYLWGRYRSGPWKEYGGTAHVNFQLSNVEVAINEIDISEQQVRSWLTMTKIGY